MKLQQFRSIWAVAHHQLNISETAKTLYTSQPAISKHIMLLESELGVEIFSRRGRHMVEITPAGEKIIQIAGEVLKHVDSIRQVAEEYSNPDIGSLRLAVTHMQARYVLPQVIEKFQGRYPQVAIQFQQESPDHVADLVRESHMDMVLTSNDSVESHDLVLLPCFRWRQSLLVPKDHPLARLGQPTLAEIAEFPLITYATNSAGHREVEQALCNRKIQTNIACTASDSDVIKSCVRMGMGVGVLATMAVEKTDHLDLAVLDASHLFTSPTSYLGIWRHAFLREFHHYFI
ncbi:MAG: LysR substrate-binding domain-containing protein, partial [Porticoccaceae bacterium]|nr:LysR substrate-binding domain-containing protein [Porticoccaceae bacterium]